MMIFVIWLANLDNKVDMRKIFGWNLGGRTGLQSTRFDVGWQWVSHEGHYRKKRKRDMKQTGAQTDLTTR